MPRKVKSFKTAKAVMEVETSPEDIRILKNRIYRFKDLLGKDYDEDKLSRLVYSNVDYWDLDKLLRNGCDPELAIEILI